MLVDKMLRHQLEEIANFRGRSSPLPKGNAPLTSSDHFKLKRGLPTRKARKWDHRLSQECLAKGVSSLKVASANPDSMPLIKMGTARPSPHFYPWASLTVREAEITAGIRGTPGNFSSVSCVKGDDTYDLDVAMDYGYAAGSPQVLRFVTEHTQLIHNPPYADWECCLTCGTTSALDIAFRILCNHGDWIITEEYTYSGTTEAAKGQGLNVLGVKMDDQGLLPDDLAHKLENWDLSKGPKPFVLYTIPTGHNPTGTTQSLERRKLIYQVAEQHDLYIIEDDPYYFLRLEDTVCSSDQEVIELANAEKFVAQLPASYLSLDVAGRVLRMDTTSKMLAPGLRCGWITGSSQLIEAYLAYIDFSTVAPSGPSQVMVFKLLDETWGHEGFIKWLTHLSAQYSQRWAIMRDACDRYLPKQLCEWTIPEYGMFWWIKIDVTKHPDFCEEGNSVAVSKFGLQVEDKIKIRARQLGLVFSKGSWFRGNSNDASTQGGHVCLRLTFATAPKATLGAGIEILGDVLRDEFKLIDEIF